MIVVLLSIWTLKSIGQDPIAQKVQLSNNQLNINLLVPSLSYERKISDGSSITLAAGTGFNHYTMEGFSGETSSKLFLYPWIYSSYRVYFKRKPRKGNLRNNSGNYIGYFSGYRFKALQSAEYFIPDVEREQYSFGVVWGMQRNYKSGIHFGFSIGPGFTNRVNAKPELSAVGEVELGFTLFSK